MNIGLCAQIACILEVTARKPGNVHREADFAGDAHFLDFLLSAAAIAEPMNRAQNQSVGATILASVEATRQVVSTNTNLGMILLLAPLSTVPQGEDIRHGVVEVLARLTIDDARDAYRAINLASAGGMGKVAEADLASEPTITLLEAMKLAEGRDIIARQYTTGFADVFDVVLPAFKNAFLNVADLESAIIEAHVRTLAQCPDTLIARKLGIAAAHETSKRAANALERNDFTEFDAWLRENGHARNPGATADLIAAALFVALRDGTIVLPGRGQGWHGLLPRRLR